MRIISLCLLTFVLATNALGAGSAPAAQLLPPDTLALVSVPDWEKAANYWLQCPQGLLWADPAMRPLRDKVLDRWRTEFVTPLERQLDIKLADYYDLLSGQVTLAITGNGWGKDPSAHTALVLLIDTKDKQKLLSSRLAELKSKWIASGKSLKTDKIRGIDFTTLIFTADDLRNTLHRAFPTPKAEKDSDDTDESTENEPKAEKTEILIGQSGSLLVVGNSSSEIEKVLARQAGGLASTLAEQASYEANNAPLFQDALGFAWVNFGAVFESWQKQLDQAAKSKPAAQDNPFAPRMDKLLTATGLGGISSIAARVHGSSDGTLAEVLVTAPESRRRGVLSLLAMDHKEAQPPGFVTTDAVKFSRWRLDGQKAWATLENVITSVSPDIAGLLQMGLQAAGKDHDPDFDLRQTLLSSLGDDFITIKRKQPADASAPDAAPSLYLVGSTKPDQFVQALKAASALMPLAGGDAKVEEREFLGRKIYSLALAPGHGVRAAKSSAPPPSLNFAATAGYAAISTDASLLEEFLRSSETGGRPLRETPGLAEAAQKVGGMSTGFFGYENQAETARAWMETAKSQNGALDKLFSIPALPGTKPGSDEGKAAALDPALLPPFERIAKYFSFTIYSLSASNEGLSWKFFAPTPPQLKH